MDNTNYNIAIIGQTGVGKSSLINYLYGEKAVETGVGRPVTTNGFHKVEHFIENMAVSIYDSWGLEVGKEDQWLTELDQELKKRGVDKPASEWFHSIFYCISAASARIQDADIKIINKLTTEANKVSVILTKADALSYDDEEKFINAIKKELGSNVAVIPVCSEYKKTRGGETKPFGKELVEKQSLIDLVDSLILRIPKHCQDIMLSELHLWRENTHEFIDRKLDIFGYNHDDLQNELSYNSEKIVREIEKLGNTTEKLILEQYKFILDKLSKRISLHTNAEVLKISKFKKENWDWSLDSVLKFLKILSPGLPMLIIQERENRSIRMHKDVDNFCNKFENKIYKRSQDLGLSLQAIKTELVDSLSIPK